MSRLNHIVFGLVLAVSDTVTAKICYSIIISLVPVIVNKIVIVYLGLKETTLISMDVRILNLHKKNKNVDDTSVLSGEYSPMLAENTKCNCGLGNV